MLLVAKYVSSSLIETCLPMGNEFGAVSVCFFVLVSQCLAVSLFKTNIHCMVLCVA